MRRLSFVLLVLVALLVALPLFAQSQATTGVIEGTVVDATGGAVPGVTVTVKNIATGYQVVVVTDSTGRFRAVLLPRRRFQFVRIDGIDQRVGEIVGTARTQPVGHRGRDALAHGIERIAFWLRVPGEDSLRC